MVIATIGAEMSIVFNNAQLPHIVRPERMGWLSGFGWGLGYCGGLVALFAVLAVSMPASSDWPPTTTVRCSAWMPGATSSSA